MGYSNKKYFKEKKQLPNDHSDFVLFRAVSPDTVNCHHLRQYKKLSTRQKLTFSPENGAGRVHHIDQCRILVI